MLGSARCQQSKDQWHRLEMGQVLLFNNAIVDLGRLKFCDKCARLVNDGRLTGLLDPHLDRLYSTRLRGLISVRLVDATAVI